MTTGQLHHITVHCLNLLASVQPQGLSAPVIPVTLIVSVIK